VCLTHALLSSDSKSDWSVTTNFENKETWDLSWIESCYNILIGTASSLWSVISC